MMSTLQFQGRLEERFLELLRKFIGANLTGRLSVVFENSKALIFVRSGWVVHAEFDQIQGTPALEQCLFLDAGDYQFESGIEPRERTITDSFSRIAVGVARSKNSTLVSSSKITISDPEQAVAKPLSDQTLATLGKVVTEALGPAGGFILEDAAAELGWELVALPQKDLGRLLETLRAQVSDSNSIVRLNAALKKGGFES